MAGEIDWQARAERAEAACAQKDDALKDCSQFPLGEHLHYKVCAALDDNTCGSGYVRKEELEQLVYSRCIKHINIPQINKNEHSGAECGACIAEELATIKESRAVVVETEQRVRNEANAVRGELKAAKAENARLRKNIEFLTRVAERLQCGCFYLDCRKHGSYIPQDIEQWEAIQALAGKEGE